MCDITYPIFLPVFVQKMHMEKKKGVQFDVGEYWNSY